jgi:AhpC/TSA family
VGRGSCALASPVGWWCDGRQVSGSGRRLGRAVLNWLGNYQSQWSAKSLSFSVLIRMWIIGIPTKVPSICRVCCEHKRTGADSIIADMNRLVEQLGSDMEHRMWPNASAPLRGRDLSLGYNSVVEELVMALSDIGICDFGWKARDFTLKGVDGKTYTLADVRGPKGTLVIFVCNHCPYVKASIGRIVAEAKALWEIGIGTIAIMPNDTEAYRAVYQRPRRHQ